MNLRLNILSLVLVFLSSVLAQKPLKIEGVIANKINNRPIVGANILIVGTERGTVTGENGEFLLVWPDSLPIKLRITHIAFESLEKEIHKKGKYIIRLNPAILEGKEVTITGKKSAADKDVSSSKEIVSLRKVEERGMRDISEVLREMSGVNIATSTTGRQTVSIRGSNANEISVYLDGIKLNRALDGEANLAFIDMSELSNVEVIRGGNTTLFGAGNFGGVILLNSGEMDRNYFRVTRSMGLTDASDQDLSTSLSFKGGPVSIGGHLSGKSRLYDGRTLFTTLFENFAGTFNHKQLESTFRYIQQGNTIKFASGGIISSDQMDVKQFNISGDILFTSGWDFQWGRRNWYWDDKFFTNIDRSLQDSSSTMRLSKTYSWRNLNGTLQVEKEHQVFAGDQSIQDSYSTNNWTDNAKLKQEDTGWASVLRYQQENPVPEVNVLRLEFAMRRSKSNYSHDQLITMYDSTVFLDKVHYQFEKTRYLNTFRLGMFSAGQLETGSRFELFFNQGTNHRIPTLNDRFLWGIGLEKTKEYYNDLIQSRPRDPIAQLEHDLIIQSIKTVLESMGGGLKPEYVSTTELSGNFIIDQLITEPISSLGFGFSIFRNAYLDKIAYKNIPKSLIAPYNTTNAWLNGIEINGKIFAWDNTFQLMANMMWVFPSDESVFPDTPSNQGNIITDFRYGILHLNLSHIFRGPQKYMRGGVLLEQKKSYSNTNLTVSASQKIWNLDFSVSYSMRNIFSKTSIVVDAANISEDGSFNYYDAYRELLTFKISLSQNKEG